MRAREGAETGRREFLRRLLMLTSVPASMLAAAVGVSARQITIPPEFDTSLDSMAAAFRSGSAMTMSYLSQPKADGRYPGVIVMHDVAGLTTPIQGATRNVAASGYLTVAPDFLSRLGGTAGFRGVEADINRAVTGLTPEIVAAYTTGAIGHLRSMKRLEGQRIGVLGFGWGGSAALTAAAGHAEIGACVAFHADTQKAVKVVNTLKAPVAAIFAGEDAAAVASIAAFEHALKKQQLGHTIKVFPGVQRGFQDPAASKVYNAEAAKEAWALAVQHLDSHLKS